MTSHRAVFNHVGLCVADRERSRRFYEGLLGFTFWWELELPDEGPAQLLQMSLSVSNLGEVLSQVEDFGGAVIEETVTEQFAMIRDPDGQLIELLPDTWLANLPPRPQPVLLSLHP